MADLRVTRQVAEVVASDPPAARLLWTTRQVAEVVASDPPPERVLRVTRQAVEVMGVDPSVERRLRVTRQAVEVMASDASSEGTAVTAETTLAIAQSGVCTHVARRSAGSTLSLSHTAEVNSVFCVQATDTLSLGVQAIGAADKSAGSALALTDQAVALVARSLAAQSTLTLSDTAQVSRAVTLTASSSLSLTGDATSDKAEMISASSPLSLGQHADAGLIKEISASNTLVVSGSADAIGVSLIEVSAASVLWLSDQAVGRNSTKHVAGQNDLALDVNAGGNKVAQVAATTPIYFTEITLDRLTFDEIEVEHGIFVSAGVYIYVDPDPTGNILSFAQRAEAVHVRADGISVTSTSALSLGQSANPTLTGDTTSQLTLGHSASATVGRVATSALALGQQASRTIERFVSAGSTLGLHQTVNVVLVEGCVTRTYTPFVGSTDDPNAPAPPSTTVPTLERVEGVQLYWPLDAPTMTVTLRGPELDNKDRLRFQRINRETRGGTLVVFADLIWPKVQQLTLEFVGLEEDEAQSLLTFIGATLGKEVGLRDWENRHWAGVIISPDEPVMRNGPHNISTALEFEGVPI